MKSVWVEMKGKSELLREIFWRKEKHCMIDEEKVKWMHRAAIFNEKEKESLYITSFYKKDYISFHVLLTAFRVFAAVLLIALLILLNDSDDLLQALDMEIIKACIFLFVLAAAFFVTLYVMIAHYFYGKRYDASLKKMKEWKKLLKDLKKVAEKEQKENHRGELS